MIRPVIRIGVLFFAWGAAALAILLAAAVWRLSQGPISFAFLVPAIETAANDPEVPFRVKFDDAVLLWEESSRRVGLRFVNARAFDSLGGEIARVPELSLSLSTRALARGTIAPRRITIYRPALRADVTGTGAPVVGDGGSQPGGQIHRVLRELPSQLGSGDLQYLDEVEVIDADLTIVGSSANAAWQGRIPIGRIWRLPDAFRYTAAVSGDGEGDGLDIQLSGDFRPAAQTLEVASTFSGLRPATIGRLGEQWRWLTGLDLPFAGTAKLSYDAREPFAKVNVAFDVRTGSGHLELPLGLAESRGIASWSQRLAIDALELRGRYQGTDGLLEIERIGLDIAVNEALRLAEPLNTELPLATVTARGRYFAAEDRIDIDEFTFDFGDGATIRLPAPVDHPLPVRSLRAEGRYLGANRRLQFAPIEIDLDGPRVVLSEATVDGREGLRARIAGSLSDVLVDDLPRYWPRNLDPGSFDWVTTHLSAGSVPRTEFAIEVAVDDDGAVAVQTLSGTMAISAVTVDYLPPLPKVVGANATATFTSDRFSVAITSGEAAGVSVRQASIDLSGLGSEEEIAAIAVGFDGPVPAVLALIDHPPLAYARATGLPPRQTAGDVAVELNLRFPLISDLTIDTIAIEATADLANLEVKEALFGRDLRNGQLALRIDKEGVEVEGRISLETIEGFVIGRQNFQTEAPFHRRIEADLRDAGVARVQEILFGRTVVPPAMIDGNIDAVVRFTGQPNHRAEFDVDLDLAKASIEMPVLGWTKTRGAAANAEVNGQIGEKDHLSFPRFAIAGDDFSLTGSARSRSNGKLERIDVQRVITGRTDARGAYVAEADGRVTATLQGASFDLVPFRRQLARGFLDAGEEPRSHDRISLAVDVGTVWWGAAHRLAHVQGRVVSAGDLLETADLGARNADGSSIDFSLKDDESGRRTVTARSDNGGSTLRTFGVFDNIAGGKLALTGTFADDRLDNPFTATLIMTDYTVLQAPNVARILSAIAITGLADAMRGDSLSFTRLEVPFLYSDGVVEVTRARATGVSLGVTASGKVDIETEQLDLNGTVIPMYALNSALGRIPLVGGVFSGGEKGGGLFAANYRLSGPFEDPQFSVNPISALAPSFLRELFSASDPQGKGPSSPSVPMELDGHP